MRLPCNGGSGILSQTTNLCMQNLLRWPNNSILAFLNKVLWATYVDGPQSARSPAQALSLNVFLPHHCRFDMVGLLLHLSGCAIIDHFISSRN